MYARVTPLALAVVVLVSAPARAQQPVSLYAVDPTSGFSRVMFGDAPNNAIRVTQVGGSQVATVFWSVRFTDGTNYLTPNIDYPHNTALTIATTAGPVPMGRASAVAPTDVTANDNTAAVWVTRKGATVTAPGASDAAGIAGTECVILSAASNNATNCKASPGNWYGYDVYNTTTTTYFLRLYNAAATPTCTSATGFIRSIPIPPAASAGQTGSAIRLFDLPIAYATGIGFCLTAGSASTDNTSAATGVFGALLFK